MSRMGRSYPNRVRFGRPILSQATVRSRTQGAQVTDSLTHVINVPEHAVGDLLYVAFSIDTGTTVTSTSSTGWQKLIEMAQGASTNQKGSVWWKRATGSDALTIDSSTAEQSTHVSLAIVNGDDPEAVAANGAAAAAAVPPAISATKGTEDYLCLVSTHTDSSAGTTQNFGLSSSFEISTTQQASTTTSAATNVQEEVFLQSNGSIAPGTVSLSLAEQWVSITTAIGSQGQAAPIVTQQGSVSLIASPTLTVSGAVARPPDAFFDLSNWKLTVPYDGPDGDTNADEIIQPALSTYVDPSYFYLDPSNQMVMDAPVNGDTTSGSSATRAELREMDGAVESAWDKTTASRQLTVSGYFDPTNITGGSAPKKVGIVGQIHETGGTPGIYLTVDYDAVPSRLRLFKDGPGVGNLVTGFVPTDRLSFRIECTDGNVNIYGSIGDETTLPAIPQFTFPASGFVEPTGSYLKTGAYNKTDAATGSTGDFLVKIVYLNLNQALPIVWPATLALTATPTLTVNVVRITPATVSLTATPTISVGAVRTTPATISLTATPTLAVNAYLAEVASVSLIASPSLTANLLRTTPASISLTASPTLSIAAPTLTTWATLALTVLPVLTVNSVRAAVSSISLIAAPTLVISSPQLVEVASVSLIASPTFTANAAITGGTQQASLSLTITPTITLSGLRVAVSSVSLSITPALTVTALLQAAATVNLIVTPVLTIDAVRITPSAVNLTVLPQLTVAALLPGASVSLIATPTISVTLYAIRPATVTLTISPTLSATVGAVPATISLTAFPTLSISTFSAIPAALSLSISPTISLSAVRVVPATLSLLASPTLSIASVQVFAAAVNLSIAPTISLSAVKARPASLTLTVTPTLSASVAPSGATVALLITPTINVSVRYIGAASVQLTASPSLAVSVSVGAQVTLALTVIPTLSVSFFGEVPASLLLIVVPTFAVDATRYVPATVSLSALPSLTVNGVRVTFPSIDLLVIPAISIDLLRYSISSVNLLIIPTISVRAYVEGAGPGWPIIFSVVSVTNGDEPVSSSQTQMKPSFAVQSTTNETGGSSAVTDPYITFKEINA
jgi:hypothetical protein